MISWLIACKFTILPSYSVLIFLPLGRQLVLSFVMKVNVPPSLSAKVVTSSLGHRLKSANNKTTAMFDALRTTRRIILSGTPIQNDLGEFHAMVALCFLFSIVNSFNWPRPIFVIPAYLVGLSRNPHISTFQFSISDNYATFRRVYEVPILNSRAPDSSAKEREVGEARSAQVSVSIGST